MASLAASLPVFISLLFLFTFSSARNIRDPFSLSESEPETSHSNSKSLPQNAVSLTLESTASISDPVPLKFISFRPINRHLPGRQFPLSYRLGRRHRCRYGLRLQDPSRLEIPYGNDAIVPRNDFVKFDPVNRGEVRQVPTVWARFREGEPRLSEVRARDHKRHHHHRKPEHEEEGGLMKRIRKFFNMF